MFDVWALAFLMVSLVIHFFVIFPFLCMWADTKPFVQEDAPRVQVRMSSVRAPKRSHAPQSTGAHSSSAPHRIHRQSKTPVMQQQHIVQATPSHAPSHTTKRPSGPRLPDSPSVPTGPTSAYPTATNNGHETSSQPNLPPAQTVPTRTNLPANGNPQANPQGPPRNGAPEGKLEGAQFGTVVDVPIPEILTRREMSESSIDLECTVDVMGNAKLRVLRSTGRDEYDQWIVQQLEATRWKPALRDGKPVVSTFPLTIKTSALKIGQRTASITKM